MTPHLYRRAQEVFASAVTRPVESRAAYLDAACGNDAQRHVELGLALAYLGREEEAIREGERGVGIYMLVGEPEKALDQLEPLLKMPYYLSPRWLAIDPNFDSLRKNPRFQKLAARAK